ncbi:hypothetical protein QBC47DRAFT_452775 [Echria macrotheca]|uniref:Inosine/uridine-preferring nucleoside hydrolase domain-containing protein n=1 Tax=Echria macrotheca TaxID=438768 RepID=A0AAJ0BBN5_9PEZI|nr:hypothetical protein QBC47DRAFT_452775 [Echria macrotheca]
MNNEQFRRLLLANSAKPKPSQNGTSSSPPTNAAGSSTPSAGALGSRLKSSIPMTPRSIAGARVDFARQLADRNQSQNESKSKTRTSAPKGSKLAQGYVDRARTRQEEQDEEDERAARLKALDEELKEEKIDRETYDRLRAEVAGGDLSSTHLVKGLDFKLLERIRRGEDVYGGQEGEPQEKEEEPQEEEDVDDVLEQLGSAEVKAIEREKVQKKGQFAPTSLNPGQKRSRNQILAELKASRAAAKAKEESTLGSKFKKIGAKQAPGMRIERDSKGREVMIIVDEDGHEKRKIRKIDPKAAEEQQKQEAALLSGTVLGMEVPEFYRKQQEEQEAEDDDKEPNIFDDAGSDYDPLAGLDSGSDSDEEDKPSGEPGDKAAAKDTSEMPPPPKPAPSGPRNYFKDSKTGLTSAEEYKAKTLAVDDPSFLAALKKAKAAAKAAGVAEKSEEDQKAAEREERLRKKLLASSRDDDDLDLGFGSSRMEDEADLEEETKVKLSAWGEDDDEEGGGGHGKEKQRKRGPKKKKGDKNSFADVMKDTFAILLAAYHPAIRILGVSTVFGNAALEKTTRNATSILTAISKAHEIPVYVGAPHALARPPMHPPTDIHGETGLDGTSLLPTPSVPPITSIPAIDAAYAALKSTPPNTAWLVATGAFTNAAALFLKYPSLVEHIRGLSLMGGAIGNGFTSAVLGTVDGIPRVGNWTQFAEFNVLADPEAAASIFENEKLAAKTTLIPLDVSHLVLATKDVQELLLYGPGGGGEKKGEGKGKTSLRVMLVELLMFFAKTYSDVFGITAGPPLHDPLAVAAVLAGVGDHQNEIPFCDSDPTASGPVGEGQRERYRVSVVTEGTYEDAMAGARTGQITVAKLPPGEEGVRIPRNLDIPLFWKVLEECVSRADAANAAAAAAAAAASNSSEP